MEGHSVVSRVKAPTLSGYALAAAAIAVERVPGLAWLLAWDASLFSLRRTKDIAHLPVCAEGLPDRSYTPAAATNKTPSLSMADLAGAHALSKTQSKRLLGVGDFHAAYSSGATTPTRVAESLLAHIAATHSADRTSPAHLHYVFRHLPDNIRSQAAASDKRWAAKSPLSPLDGVPILVKDEVDVKGYETTCGTSFINKGNPADEDATTVAKLRALGAIIIGKASMDEYGWSVFGVNPNTGTARNPHHLAHSCGGSSGGSAGAVAAGFVPIAIGCDGGGSIRIPASFCGVWGLKPTTGRISAAGEYPIAHTVAVQGPIAATIDDLAMAYLAMAGPDPKNPVGLGQPPVHLSRSYLAPSMKGVRVGIMPAYSAQVSNPAITKSLELIQSKLVEAGAELVEIKIPHLDDIRIAHLVTIASEMCAGLVSNPENHQLIWMNRVHLAILQNIKSVDYVLAQKLRHSLIQTLQNLFQSQSIRYILTPTTAITSPPLPSHRSGLSLGYTNNTLASDAMRFVFMANLGGVPGISFPVGADDEGLPVGIQVMTEWWGEGDLLVFGKWVEQMLMKSNEKGSVVAGRWIGDMLKS